MHELSIAMGIINIAEKEIEKAQKKSVSSIDLEIGSMSGVELSSLEYVWKSAVQNTVLEKAKLNINFKQAKAKCLECLTIFEMSKLYDSCPKCNSHFKDILQGKELIISSLELI